MANPQDKLFYFYQRNQLTTIKGSGSARSILRTSNAALAEVNIDVEQITSLLKSDDKCSVLAVRRAEIEEAISYSSYGETPDLASSNTSLGFNGERYQPQLNVYLLGNGYRAYNCELRRFHSPDSLSPFDRGGINAYSYCSVDPINNSDPTGHMPRPVRANSSPRYRTLSPPPSAPPAYDTLPSAPRPLISTSPRSPQAGYSTSSLRPSAPPHSPRPSVSYEPSAPPVMMPGASQSRLETGQPPIYSRHLPAGHTSSLPIKVSKYELVGAYIKKLEGDISDAKVLAAVYRPGTKGRKQMLAQVKKLTKELAKEQKIYEEIRATPDVQAYLVRQTP